MSVLPGEFTPVKLGSHCPGRVEAGLAGSRELSRAQEGCRELDRVSHAQGPKNQVEWRSVALQL